MWDVKKLTLDQKIGQLFVFGFTDPDKAVELIERYKFGNIIYFRRNLGTGESMVQLSQRLQQAMMEHVGIPALIASDQEGGMLNRFSKDATNFPGAMALAATEDVKLAYQWGKRLAEEMSSYGINFDLAPVLDINSNPLNPVIGVRSFSDDKEMVKEFGIAMMRGMQDAGVLACGKHFPGHGDTHMDSHVSLPKLGHSLERIEEEIEPFRHAVDEGIASIMSAHLLIPALEDGNIPATMSYKILTGLLRERLGFDGLIITDCLEMDAIAKYYGVREGAINAIKAGANLMCICHTAERQIDAFEGIKQAVLDGEIAMEDLDYRVQQILDYKKKFGILEGIQRMHTISDATLEDNRAFTKEIYRKSLTLIKDRTNLLPICKEEKILVVSPLRKILTGIDGSMESYDFAFMLNKRLGCEAISYEIDMELSEYSVTDMLEECAKADKVIVGAYNATIMEDQQRLIEKIIKANPNIILVALRIPYDASLFDDQIPTALCTYEYTEEAIHELLDGMMGQFSFAGKLPVKIG